MYHKVSINSTAGFGKCLCIAITAESDSKGERPFTGHDAVPAMLTVPPLPGYTTDRIKQDKKELQAGG